MIPGRIPEATRVLGAPQGWDEARDGWCGGLAILDVADDAGSHRMVSAWEPTPEELAKLNAGAPVLLSVVGLGHPPVWLSVGEAK